MVLNRTPCAKSTAPKMRTLLRLTVAVLIPFLLLLAIRSRPQAQLQMVLVDREGRRTPVGPVPSSTFAPRVSPDGSTIAFLATDEGRKPLGLYVADLQSCDARRIARVNSPHAFAWWPDGRSIVFSQLDLVDNAREFGDLYRVDVASGAITRMTRSAASWSG